MTKRLSGGVSLSEHDIQFLGRRENQNAQEDEYADLVTQSDTDLPF